MSLLAPLFLFGLLAALIPWWLHRLSASNPPKRDFGSTRFIEPNQSPSSSKKRTHYWPLLALRFLFLALLSLIFAEPVIEQLKATGTSATRHILVIDTSMSQKLEGRWQQTLDTANQILNDASDNDESIVISAADQFVQNQQQTDSIDSAREQLGTLTPGNTRLDYGRISSAVAAAASDTDDISNHLHIITDAQATAMPERFTSLAVDKIQKINVYSTASDNDHNASVTGKIEHVRDNSANVLAVVSNYGDAKNYTVSATANGTTLDSTELEVGANQIEVYRFSNINIADVESQLELRLEPKDGLTDDNIWLLPLPEKKRSAITLLTSDIQPSVANTYVKAALESNPRFSAKFTDASRFAPANAGTLIIVPDASVITDRTATHLREYINNGGNALIAVSDKPHNNGVSSLLGITASVRADTTATSVGSIDSAHQVTANLLDNWRAISVLSHHALITNITDRNIIELSNGSPLLVEKRIGSGKILLLSSALNPEWTDLPTESVFVAFMMQAVDYLGGDTSTALYRSTGDTLNVAAGAQLIDPSGNSLRDLAGISERSSLKLTQPGIYELRSSAGTQSIAVNFEPQESDITTIDDATIERWQQVATRSVVNANTSGSNSPSKNNQKNFWMWLLPLLLLLALLESLYSHRHLWIRREA